MQAGGARSLTVLMTADAVGGVWHYALGLCAALPEIRFVMAVMGPLPSAAQRDAASALANVTLEEYGHRLEWMHGAAEHLAPSRHWLRLLARRHGADLLHVNGYAHALNDAGLPTLAVAHSDVLSWWRAVHREPAPPEWDGYRREVIAGLRAADRVVAPTAAVLDDLAREYGFRRGPGIVIANGIETGDFAPQPKRAVIMAAGRVWDAAKNLALLDQIAGDLDWPIEMAGNAAHPEGAAVQFSGARLLGALEPKQIADRLGQAAIFAAPALYEPFGLAILEAAASGCALVLGDIPSLREIWSDAALFVPSNDRAAWRSTLACLIVNDHRRQALGDAARQRACRFTREAMARRYAALYRELVDRSARREVA
jgi:glycosyltransferase involved in cell wall biosynthesis